MIVDLRGGKLCKASLPFLKMKFISILLILFLVQASDLKFHSFTIPYGSGKEELGILIEPETPPIGPSSFSVDRDGNIYIADPVNSSIKVFSGKEGKLLKFIPFKGFPDDIAVSENEDIYILDRTSSEIFIIRPDGKQESKRIESDFSLEPSKLILWKGEVFVRGEKKIKNLSLEKKHEISYFYEVEYISRNRGILKKLNSEGVLLSEFPIERDNMVSLEFLNEDGEGNIYIQIEFLISENDVRLEARKINSSGEIVSVIPIPENDYFVWTSRLLFVDREGKIYQVLPKRDFVKVNVWE